MAANPMMTNQFDTISMINSISQLEHTASFSSKPKRMEKSKPKLEKKSFKRKKADTLNFCIGGIQ